MEGSIDREAETDPLINGGSYRLKSKGPQGQEIFGVVMGVSVHAERKEGEGPKKIGKMYTEVRGSIPIKVVEGTESLSLWELVAAPSASAAGHAKGRHNKE